jgi:glycerol-1-phosphate dehydrogenase [NAD(P)+]
MSILAAMMDQALNRLSGVYSGFEPKRPNALIIPRFVQIERNIPSLLDAVLPWVELDRLQHPLVVSDAVTWNIAGGEFFGELEQAGREPVRALVEKGNLYAEAERIALGMCHEPKVWSEAERPWERRLYGPKVCSVVFGVGGGTVIDIAKVAAFHLHVPCVTVPTSLAHDGIASPFAVIRPGGENEGTVTVVANTPMGVLIDLGRIKPKAGEADGFYRVMMRSGIGDAVSNLTATLDWALAAEEGRDTVDYLALLHARSAGEVVLARLNRDEPSVKARLEGSVGGSDRGVDRLYDDDLVLTLAAALVSSGEAMARVGSSRPASGFDHKFYHAFSNLLGFRSKATHGILVAIGALVSARVHGQWQEQMQRGFGAVGLPVDLHGLLDLGIRPSDVEQAIRASIRVKPERYTILEHVGAERLVEAFREIYGVTGR